MVLVRAGQEGGRVIQHTTRWGNIRLDITLSLSTRLHQLVLALSRQPQDISTFRKYEICFISQGKMRLIGVFFPGRSGISLEIIFL